MNVRKLRISAPAGCASSDIDSVSDPTMLAHRLLDLEVRPEQKTFDHTLRMSGIHNVCVRAQLLGIRHNIVYNNNLPVAMRVTFDIGNAIHYFLQNTHGYLGKNRLGWWRCLSCRNKIFGRKPRKECPICKSFQTASVYEEHSLKMPHDIPVSGHIDGFLEVNPGDIRIVDFKTINGEDFASLTSPLPSHKIQVIGYAHYIQKDDSIPVKINPDKALILYISKKHTARNLPFKMFHVNTENMYLDIIKEKVAEFKRGLYDTAYLPEPMKSCADTDFKSSACRECKAYSYCVEAVRRDGK